MAKARYPRTVKSGPLAGQTFLSEEEYQAARKMVGGDPTTDGKPLVKARGKAAYTKAMVAALVKLVEGLTSIVPAFRGKPFSEQESTWLTDDWYDFGKRNAFFADLVTTIFSVSQDSKLVLDHVAIFGARVVATEDRPGLVPAQLDDQVRLVASMAYLARSAMDNQIVEQPSEPPRMDDDSLGLAPGGAPLVDREDREREDVPPEADFRASRAYDSVGR